MKPRVIAIRGIVLLEKESKKHETASKAMKVGELFEKGSKEHETASKSNESGIEISERKQETLNCN